MPTCRCKMCGGQNQYDIKASIAKCEFCGTEQTEPGNYLYYDENGDVRKW